MAKRLSIVIWHGFDQKCLRLAGIHEGSRRAVELAYPGFLTDPPGLPSTACGAAA